VKVMNALWGAGQMMFNKMMVILDAEVDIHNYTEVMKAICENTYIEEDVYLQKGPLDVLDHSSNQFAFGGKIGLDATKKNHSAEKDNFSFPASLKEKIKADYPEIIEVNDSLLQQNIPLLILSLKKNKPDQISTLHKQLVISGIAEGIKFIIYLDEPIDIFDLKNVVWRCSNNTDAFRDIFKVTSGSNKTILGIDGTMKNKQFDGFQRDWPNIVVSDEKTIKAVDEKWSTLGLGEFIPSPSLKYLDQLYGKGAVAEE
jgi:4-hydroxy-3-polyprenylbenzoate decarboxylase